MKNNKKKEPKNKKKTQKSKPTIISEPELAPKRKLVEFTAFKNIDNKKSKKHTKLWIKSKVLDYEVELHRLQIELLKYQKHIKDNGLRVLILFEGRDAAGKGGTIKRIMQHINPRGARVVALEKPSDIEVTQWYFQRYVQHLPHASEMVLFDRSWYNRAMVEPVMGFCSDEQNKRFLKDVPMFEEMLVKDGIILMKYFFSVSKEEQMKRFESRKTDPLKHFKISPVDMQAQDLWDQYTIRKFQMLTETNRTLSPWTIIRSTNKKRARINCIKHLLSTVDYKDKISAKHLIPDPSIVISGIDELKYMEDNLMSSSTLPG
ncbi:MAG: polyphosphate kinase 2 [Desulfobulbaceae bacterium]|nr:polyphosphate kinase 2 [Desulfobulbaceae bacterium]